MTEFQPWALEMLACPRCRESVRLDEVRVGLVCDACRLLYPIEDGIPQMLAESARALDEEDGAGSRSG